MPMMILIRFGSQRERSRNVPATKGVVPGLLWRSSAGFLVGGVVSFWSRNKFGAVVCAVLAVLALGAAVLRLVPGA